MFLNFLIISTKQHLILRHEGVLGFGQDPDEHLLGEGVEGDQDWEPATKLRDHPELDEVLGLDPGHVAVLLPLVVRLAAQAPLRLTRLGCCSPSLTVGGGDTEPEILLILSSGNNLEKILFLFHPLVL